MTIQMDEADVIAALVGSGVVALVALLFVGWLFYLLVRPRRRRREKKEAAMTAAEVEQMLELIERMEQRLAVVERVVAQDGDRQERILEAGRDPELRRIK